MSTIKQKRTTTKKHIVIEALEQRFLFSADFFSSGLDGFHVTGLTEQPSQDWRITPQIPVDGLATPAANTFTLDSTANKYSIAFNNATSNDTGNAQRADHLTPLAASDPPYTKVASDPSQAAEDFAERDLEVVIIDAGVADSQKLLSDLKTTRPDQVEWKIISLDADQDGIRDITQTLHGMSGIKAIHILSHGDSQGFQLGSSRLDSSTVPSYLSDLDSWGRSLTEDADLLIYGCDLASSEAGRLFVDTIADTTGADVAASTDATGHVLLGADWQLEYSKGDINTDIAISAEIQNDWISALPLLNSPTDISSGIELNVDTGNDAYLLAADGGAILGGLTSVTIEVSFSAQHSNDSPLFSYAAGTAGGHDLTIIFTEMGSAQLYINGDVTPVLNGIDYNDLLDGNLHHLAATWDATNGDWAIYADSELVDYGSGLATGSAITGTTGTGEIVLGQEQDSLLGGFSPDQNFKGTYYDVRIWDRVQSKGEIALNAQQKFDTANLPGGLIANWQMDGFNASNDIVDVVSGNNFSVQHAVGAGFTNSTPTQELNVDEISANGTSIGFVIPSYTDASTDVATLLSNDSTLSYDATTGKFYRFVDTASDFTTALTAATTDSLNGVPGQLVTINSAYENQYILDWVTSSGNQIWIGASDANTEGTWNWLDGAAESTETFWTGGNGGSAVAGVYSSTLNLSDIADEDYIRMVAGGAWGDDTISGQSSYVVEWQATEVLSSFTFSLTDDAGGRFAIDTNTGEVTVANGALLDYETNASHNITVEVTGAPGNTFSEIMQIAVNNQGEITQTLPGPQVTLKDGPLVFSTANSNVISVSDTVVSTDTRLQVYLSSNFNGNLTLSQTTGLSIVGGFNGGSFMTIHGTESDINAALDGLVFTPVTNYTGPVTLDMTTSLGADLEGHYEFEANANDTSVGLVQHGTLIGNAAITSDATRGQVLSIDGDGDAVQITGTYNNPANVTFAAWVNLASADTFAADVISLGDRVALSLDDSTVGLQGFFYESGPPPPGAFHSVSSIDNIILAGGGWNHIAYVLDDTNNTHSIFLNGIEVASSSTGASIGYNTGFDTFIGSHGDGDPDYDLNGLIDDARIYDRALSKDEIVALATEQTVVSDSVAISVEDSNTAPYFTTLPSAQPTTIAPLVGATSVTSGDLDSDGDIDLLATTDSGELLWYENDGLGNFSAEFLIATGQDFGAVVATDIDGDTDIDIVVANDDPTDLNDSIYVLTNNFIGSGSVSFTTATFEGSGAGEFDGADDLAVEDIDGDGRKDIVATFYRSIGDSQLAVFEQNAVGVFSKTFSDTVNVSNAEGIHLADMDGDLDLDIVAGDFQNQEINWYENDGNATAGFTYQSIASVGNVFDLAVADLDGDTDQDIGYISWGSNTVGWLENDGSANPVFVQHIVEAGISSLDYHIEISDVNNDASNDLIIIDKNSDEIRLYNNDGIGNFTRTLLDTTTDGPVWAEAADIDADGHNDVIYAAANGGSIGVHLNQGDGGFVRGITNEDVNIAQAVQISDDDAGTAIIEVAITSTNGSLLLTTSSVLVLSGSSGSSAITIEGTVADLNTALATLIFSPTQDYNGIGRVDILLDDRGASGIGGPLTATETLFIDILPVNDAPALTNIEIAPVLYTENGAPIGITGNLTIGDVDDTNVESATVSITGNFVTGADVLAFTDQLGITGSYDTNTGILTLTGSAALADYETALRSVTYQNTSDNPSTSARTISFIVNDGDNNSNLLSRNISITAVNDPPVLTNIEVAPALYTENGPPISITGNLTVSDVDDTNIDSATVSITGNFVTGEDVLAFTDQLGITGSYDTNTGILTLTGSATLADYETAFHSVTYQNTSDNPSTSNRTISFVINDGDDNSNLLSRDILITDVNDPPALSSIEVGPVLYTENAPPIGITDNLTIGDVDDTNIDSATVSITGNFVTAEDVLAFTDQLGITGSYDTNTGILTLTGSATLADYETALHSVTYQNTSDNPSSLNRTVSFVVNNGDDNSNPVSRDISLTAVNDPPALTNIEVAPVLYTENGAPIGITGNLTIGDVDDTNIDSATVSITGNFVTAEDVLAFTDQLGITGSYDTNTGILALTGSATLADYETALHSVTYQNTSDNPSISSRTTSFVVNDGDDDSNVLSRDISLTAVNDPPALTNIEAAPVFYTENGAPIGITGNLTISDVDDTNIDSATVSITGNFVTAEDVLAFTDQLGITGGYDAINGILTLTGSASLADYETAIHSITYQNSSENPSTLNRTVSITINDGDTGSNQLSRDIVLSAVNDAPQLSTIETAPVLYTENGMPAGITGNLAINDVDDTSIESATVSITGNFATGEDVLVFTDQAGISGSYDIISGILTLTGSATQTDYESAIHSVTFRNTSDNPSTLDRTVAFLVNDGDDNSNLLSRNIVFTAVNDAPVLSTIETAPALYTENGAGVGITGNLAVSDIDDTNIESASVSITGNFASGEDVLAYTDQLGITGSYDTISGVLTLTGTATATEYETALHTVAFQNTSDDPSTLNRTVSFVINDGDDNSNLLSRDITFTAVNDPPELANIETAPAQYTENSTPTGITGNLSISDVDDSNIESASVSITGNYASGEDILAFTDQLGITGIYDTFSGILTLTGSAPLVDYDSAIRSITYQNSSDNPSTLNRTVSFTVNDGDTNSNMLSRDIVFTAVNDPPVLSTIESAPALYVENSAPVGLTGNLAVDDADDTNIESATVSITGNFAPGEDVLAFTDQPGITGTYDAVNGIMTLTGSATLADYEAAIHTIGYHNTSDNPSVLNRTVSFIVNDGDTNSNMLSRDIVFSAINDPPVLSTIESAPALYVENSAPVGLTGNLAVDDADDTNIESATVSITGNFSPGEDVLAFTDQLGISSSYNAANGILTLTGSASLIDYEAALHTVTYQNISDNPSTLARTISFVVNDDETSGNLVSRDVALTAVNDAPALSTIETAPALYTENGLPVGLTGNLTISDIDNTNITSATVSITGNFALGEDALTFNDQLGIIGNYNPTTGVLTLVGTATLADYETAIHSVTYQNTSDNPSTLNRTVSFVVNDGADISNPLYRDITFTAVNDQPVLSSIEVSPVIYLENAVPVGITGNLSVDDVDDTHIESATVSINANFASGEDVLVFTDQSGITGSYDTVNGIMALTGSASLVDYESAIHSITYLNTSDDPSALDRTVSVIVNDGDINSNALSRDIELTAINDAPVLSTIETAPALYTENGAPIGITGNLGVSDIDDTHIESATVSITDNFATGEDALIFTDQLGITGNFNTVNGIMTLTGSATLADYETAIHTITYHNTSDNPSTLVRTVSVVVNDGDNSSNPLSRDIAFTAVNDPPVLSTIETAPASYTENGAPIAITGNLAVSDIDDTHIESASISITGNFAISEDVLEFSDQLSISGNYNASTGILTLTGSASPADYEAAIQSITYRNTSDSPSELTRTVSFTLNDGDAGSNVLSRDIVFTAVNDPPELINIETNSATYIENDAPVGITDNLAISDVDDSNITSATISITGNFTAGEDGLAFTNQPGITGSYDAINGILTLSGSAALSDYETALHSITYSNNSDNPAALDRTVSFVVNDGNDSSNTSSREIVINAVNDAPVLSTIEMAPALYTENGSPIGITGNLTVGDIDDSNIESASVSITGNFATGEDVLEFTDQFGITGVYDAVTGVLTLTGSAALTDYQAAIQSVSFQNTSDNPSDLNRTVSFVVNDGNVSSNQLYRDIVFTTVNDPPVISNIELLPSFFTENDDPVGITDNLALSDVDDTYIESASVYISANFAPGEDELAFTDQSGIAGSYDATTGTMMLTGSATLADYVTAIHSVSYQNASDDPTTLDRTVSFSVNDGDSNSNVMSRNITFTAVNDSPALSTIETAPALYTENSAAISVTGNLSITDVDDTKIESATVAITGNFALGEDILTFTDHPGVTGSYDTGSGVLALTGTATLADYETAIHSIGYQNTSDNPSGLDRTVSFLVNDGDINSNITSRNITFTAVNDSPVLSTIETAPAIYFENSTSIGVTGNLAISDVDDSRIESATVSIGGNFTAGEDELFFTNQQGIAGSYDNTSGILTLSGSATAAEYQQALQSITYANSSEHPNPLARQVSFAINDGELGSNVLTRDIEIVRLNDAPVTASVELNALIYSENLDPTPVTTTLVLNDIDNINLFSASVQITGNYQPAEDRLDYVGTGDINATWNAVDGVLTLTGTDTLASYQTALRSVTYANTSDDPNSATRTLSFTVNDGDTDSNIAQRDIVLSVVNDAPELIDIENTNIIYIENAGPAPLTNTLSLADRDDQFIESAAVTISSGYNNIQDQLSFIDTPTISAAWDAAAATLTLTGTDTISAYQAALRTVRYENIDDNPTLDSRTVSFSIGDGDIESNILSREITIIPINDSPVVAGIENTNLEYLENDGGITITSNLTVDDIDDTTLDSAIVRISGGYHPAEDRLVFTDTPNITGLWDSVNGVLSMSGSDTIAAYQAALRSVLYDNSSDLPAIDIRTIDFRVYDGELHSNSITQIITVSSVNDAPAGSDNTLTVLEDTNYVLSRTDFGFTDVQDNNAFSAVTVSKLPVHGLLSMGGLAVSTGQVINVSDIDAGLLVFSPQPDSNAIAYDQMGFQVQDDGGNAHGGSFLDPQVRFITFNVTSVNDAPTGGDSTVTTPEDTNHVFSRADFKFTDPRDNDSFKSLVVSSLPDTGVLKNNGMTISAGSVIDVSDIDNGLLIYTPPANDSGFGYNGFSFFVQDTGGTANGGDDTDPTANFISFDLPGVNDPPLLITENTTVDEGSENLLTTAVLTATDADDLLATELTFSLQSIPLHGQLTLNGSTLSPGDTFTLAQIAGDQLRYTHDGSETDNDFFDVSVQDGGEDGSVPSSGRFSITVTEVIDPAPELQGDQLNLKFGQSFNSLNGDQLASGYSALSTAELLSNTVLLVEIEEPPKYGTLELNPDGTFSYMHDGSAVLYDFFTYRVTNEDGVYTIAQVNITIEAPIASAFASIPETPEAIQNELESPAETTELTTEIVESQFPEWELLALPAQHESSGTDVAEVLTNVELGPIEARVTLQNYLEELDVKQHNKIKHSALYNDSVAFNEARFEVYLDLNPTRLNDILSNDYFLEGLSRFDNDLLQSEEQRSKRHQIAVDTSLGISLSASAGVVAWLLRGGALFASAMASTPLWSSIDPVRVQSSATDKDKGSEKNSNAEDELEGYFTAESTSR